MAAPFEVWFHAVPPITRTYLVAATLATVACHLQIVSPWDLYINFRLVGRGELWRLVTNFVYFGPLGIDLFYHMFFLTRYSMMLEQNQFRNRPADFVYMLLLGAIMLLCAVPFVDVVFLGSALSFMMVYVWAKYNPDTQFSFLGLLNFKAPMLPWVLCGFAYLINNHIPVVDLLGIGAGNVYYYLAERMPNIFQPRRQVLHTPAILKWLFNPPNLDEPIGAGVPANPPGGYAWGGAAPEGAAAAAAGNAGGAGARALNDIEDETVPAHQTRAPSNDDRGAGASS